MQGKNRVLIVGSGGREHVLCQKIKGYIQSKIVPYVIIKNIYCRKNNQHCIYFNHLNKNYCLFLINLVFIYNKVYGGCSSVG